MKYQNHVIGTLNVESSHANAYTSHHKELLDSFSDQAAVAIEVNRRLTRRIRELEAVGRLQQVISDIGFTK
jgi:GAF domain-containing protein